MPFSIKVFQFIWFITCWIGMSVFPQTADLSLIKGTSSTAVIAGSELTYTLTVTNLGPDEANTITVIDYLPEGSSFLSASPECIYNEPLHQCDCTMEVLGPSEFFSFNITIEADWPPSGTTVGVYLTGTEQSSSLPSVYFLNTSNIGGRSALSVNNLLINPRGVDRESDDSLLVVDLRDPVVNGGSGLQNDGAIFRVHRGDGSQSIVSENEYLVNPTALVILEGSIFVADPDSGETFGRVLMVDSSSGAQTIVTELDLLQHPTGICLDEDGSLLVVDTEAPFRLVRVDPGTGNQTLISEGSLFQNPVAVALEETGVVIIADTIAGIIRVHLETGAQTLIAAPTGFEFIQARDVEVARNGDIYVADPLAFEGGAILHFNPLTGELLTGFLGGPEMGYQEPYGLELFEAIDNTATVSSETADPEPNNNTASHLTEIHDLEAVQIIVVEHIAVSDQVQIDPAVMISVTENVAVVDQVTVTPAVIISVTEGISVSDQITFPPPVVIVVNESINVSDTVNLQPSAMIQIVEAISVSDSVSLLPAAMISISETVAITDSVTVLPAALIQISESISVSDQVTFSPPVVITVQESIAVADQVTVTPAAIISVTEAIAVADLVTVSPAVQINVTEQITVSDTPNIQPAVMISVNESISVSDIVAILEDLRPPTVVELRTIATNKRLIEGDETRRAITQIYVIFSKPVNNPDGDSDPDDVTNPSNYMLVSDGGDGVFDTISCEGGVSPLDTAVDLGPIDYMTLDRSAVIRILNGAALTEDTYRLFVCGTTSIIDLQGQALDGDGDGTEGDDHVTTFQIIATNLLTNPNFDESLSGWDQQVPSGTNLDFTTVDVTGLTTSGTARMTNEGITGDMELSQCLVTDSEGWIRMGGRLYMSRSAGAPEATVIVEWYDDTACEGNIVEEWEVTAVTGDTATEWFSFTKTGRVPDGAQSARFLVVVSVEEGEGVQAYWDELYFLYDPALILFDGLESGDLNNWTE